MWKKIILHRAQSTEEVEKLIEEANVTKKNFEILYVTSIFFLYIRSREVQPVQPIAISMFSICKIISMP